MGYLHLNGCENAVNSINTIILTDISMMVMKSWVVEVTGGVKSRAQTSLRGLELEISLGSWCSGRYWVYGRC